MNHKFLLHCLVLMLCLPIPVGSANALFSRQSFRFFPRRPSKLQNISFRKLKITVKDKARHKFDKLQTLVRLQKKKSSGLQEEASQTKQQNISSPSALESLALNQSYNVYDIPPLQMPMSHTSPVAPSTILLSTMEAVTSGGHRYLSSEVKWVHVGEANGIQVSKAKTPLTTNKDELRWSCFKTLSVVNCSLPRLYDTLMETEKILQYSEWSESRVDVETQDNTTAISWSKSKSVMGMKPHDFCSLSHTVRVDNRTVMVVMQSVEHPDIPLQKDYSRSKIVFSLNLLRDISHEDSSSPHTELTTISHVSYTGVLPFLVNGRAYQGIIDLMTALDSFATSDEE